jgi:hypothetical protein
LENLGGRKISEKMIPGLNGPTVLEKGENGKVGLIEESCTGSLVV